MARSSPGLCDRAFGRVSADSTDVDDVSGTAYGSGEDDAAATAARNAESNARYNALALLRGTACPRCGRFSSAVRAALREASAKQSRLNKARIRLAPVSAGVGLLVGLALFAALGWRPLLLLGTAGLTALGWAVVVLFTVRRVPVPPLAETQRIWFWGRALPRQRRHVVRDDFDTLRG